MFIEKSDRHNKSLAWQSINGHVSLGFSVVKNKKFKKNFKKTREGLNVAAPKLILKFKGLIFAAQHQNHLKWRNNRAAQLVSQAVWNEVCQIEVGELIYRSMTSILCFYPPSSACSPLNCIELFFGNEKNIYLRHTLWEKVLFVFDGQVYFIYLYHFPPPYFTIVNQQKLTQCA